MRIGMATSRHLVGWWLAWASLCGGLLAAEPQSLVVTQRGELPIILSAPHGGNEIVLGAEPRKGEGLKRQPGGFVTARDAGIEELAHEVADAIALRFGKPPYFVISRAHRKFLDPNRAPAAAYECDAAKTVYDAYHAALDEACREVGEKFRAGLLLDLHGQGSAKDTVFRGTKNGTTVAWLRQRFGEAAHTGDASLLGQLKRRGWTVHPDPFDGREQPGYTGGYIVQRYGGQDHCGIDAVQLEFGASYRSPARRLGTATVLADALADYAIRYFAFQLPAPIEVAVYAGAGTSNRSRTALAAVLAQQPRLELRDIMADEIRQGKLEAVKVLIHPGGSGSAQGRSLGPEGREQIREFVQRGGGYLGICAGAYLATCDYDWSLRLLDATVVDREHWNRGFGNVDISLTPRGMELLGIARNRLSIYYHQGPLLAPADNPDIPDYDGLAKFETEIVKNGAPQGIMLGQTAIATGVFHQGRVCCFSPHPERTAGLEKMLLRAVSWCAGEDASDERHRNNGSRVVSQRSFLAVRSSFCPPPPRRLPFPSKILHTAPQVWRQKSCNGPPKTRTGFMNFTNSTSIDCVPM